MFSMFGETIQKGQDWLCLVMVTPYAESLRIPLPLPHGVLVKMLSAWSAWKMVMGILFTLTQGISLAQF